MAKNQQWNHLKTTPPRQLFRGSAENCCMDGLINYEEPFSGLNALGFNPVSYNAKTNYL